MPRDNHNKQAIEQIERLDYTKDLQQRGHKVIIKYGVVFVGKSCVVRVKI